jgi:hypothetical protein
LIGKRDIEIILASLSEALIIRNLGRMLRVFLFINVMGAAGVVSSYGQSICPAAALGYQYQ